MDWWRYSYQKLKGKLMGKLTCMHHVLCTFAQFSLCFVSIYLHQPKKYYNDSLYHWSPLDQRSFFSNVKPSVTYFGKPRIQSWADMAEKQQQLWETKSTSSLPSFIKIHQAVLKNLMKTKDNELSVITIAHLSRQFLPTKWYSLWTEVADVTYCPINLPIVW